MTNEQGKYVRYSANLEAKQENEDADAREIRASLARGRVAACEKHRHAVRDAHAKSHGILKGELKFTTICPKIGSIQRVRRPVCDESTDYRHQMNARKRVEPASIDELPG